MRDTIHSGAAKSPRQGAALPQFDFIGFGLVGYYIPNYYWRLPFNWHGTVLPDLIALMVLVFVLGAFAVVLDWRLDPVMHQLLGFVLGFLLVIMGNLSNGKYNEAVSAMNRCVQDGTSLCSELLSLRRRSRGG